MSRWILAAFAALMLVTVGSAFAENNQPPAGYKALFNGKDLAGWRGRPHLDPAKEAGWDAATRKAKQAEWDKSVADHWRVSDGIIINDGHGVFLTTEDDYKNFELYVDWWMTPEADSGIYLKNNPQIQIWNPELERDHKHGADKGSGALWNNKKHERWPLVKADNPAGQWNTFYVRMIGDVVTVKLNGKLVVDNVVLENYFNRSKPLPETGPIQLQTHGGEMRFRNIYIRELPDDAKVTPNSASAKASKPNTLCKTEKADGFKLVFNGKNFDGWAGPVDNYQVVDGALMCKPGHGGTIFTKKQYGDFIARLEFKLPPAGNNGLAIRYPGEGNAAYHGMTELQVLDNDHPKYAKLDPRQFHGSAYGMVAAKRGALKPTGEWNQQEVVVKGSTIKVTLNGEVILDTDLSEVTEYMGGKPHPGKDRSRGHFGFAGHNEPVQFRSIRIKSLD